MKRMHFVMVWERRTLLTLLCSVSESRGCTPLVVNTFSAYPIVADVPMLLKTYFEYCISYTVVLLHNSRMLISVHNWHDMQETCRNLRTHSYDFYAKHI